MFKRILLAAALGLAGCVVTAEQSDAGIFFRPVRRVAARAVLPPYPVARTVLPPYPVARTVYYGTPYTPVYRPVIYGTPYVYGYSPYVYGGGVSVSVGY
jgi:hypothetical protein